MAGEAYLIGNFLNAFGQAKQNKANSEEQKQLMALQKKKMDLDLKKAEFQQKILDAFIGQQQTAQQPQETTPQMGPSMQDAFPETAPKQPGLTDILADPQKLAMLKLAGIGDLSGVANMMQDQNQFSRKMEQDQSQFKQRLDFDKLKFGTEQETKRQEKEKGMSSVSDNLSTMVNTYLQLNKVGGVPNIGNTSIENIFAKVKSSAPGQIVSGALGTEEQSLRNVIKTIQPALINSIRKASNMGAKGLDSERELDFYLRMATDVGMDIQSNLAAIAILDDAYGDGTVLRQIEAVKDPVLLKRIDEMKQSVKGSNTTLPEGWKIEKVK